MTMFGAQIRFFLAYCVAVVAAAAVVHLFGIQGTSGGAVHLGMVAAALSGVLLWFSARNGRYLNGQQMLGIAGFAYILNLMWTSFSVYWYFKAHGKPLTILNALTLQLRLSGVRDFVFIFGFVHFGKSAVVRLLAARFARSAGGELENTATKR